MRNTIISLIIINTEYELNGLTDLMFMTKRLLYIADNITNSRIRGKQVSVLVGIYICDKNINLLNKLLICRTKKSLSFHDESE